MMLMIVVFVIALLCVLLRYFNFIGVVKDFFRFYISLNKFPSLPKTPILGNLRECLCDDVEFFKLIRIWNRDYGPIYSADLLMHKFMMISGPDEFEVIATSNKHLRKGFIYNFFHRWLGTGLLTSYGTQWQTRRKILTPAFHFSVLKNYVTVFNKESGDLVKILERHEGSSVNIMPLITQFTMRSITATVIGHDLDVSKEMDTNFVDAIHRIGKIFYYRTLRPWFFTPFIFYNFSGMGILERKMLHIIFNFTNMIIKSCEQHFQKIDDSFMKNNDDIKDQVYDKRRLTMLDLLINAKITNGIIDDDGIKDEVNTFLFEGHDTTAMSLSFIFMLLACHRNIQDRVYEEIENLQCENPEHMSLTELTNLNYMECVIKECLRLYPSVPFIARCSDEEITMKNGLILPKGLQIYIHIFDIHRNPKYWPEPEKFDPDRFLPENSVGRHPFSFVPFSAGYRNCIGQKFAILEIKAVLCSILRNFILEPVDTPDTIELVPDVVLRTAKGIIRVKITKRNSTLPM